VSERTTRKRTAAPITVTDPFPVRVVRSRKRKRTVSARLIDGEIELSVPSWMSDREASEFAERMQARFARKNTQTSLDLADRAAKLAKRHDLPTPASIRWVSNQKTRWGSCSFADASIRLSDRMVGMPEWVVDAVIVHELAHLVHPDHGAAFKALETRFPRQDEASAFLDGAQWAMARGLTADTEPDEPDEPTAEPELGCSGDDAVKLEPLDSELDLGQLRLDLVE
jgi:predicted metal-dependent hydrolase